jgi:hypothetical protein
MKIYIIIYKIYLYIFSFVCIISIYIYIERNNKKDNNKVFRKILSENIIIIS